MSVVGCGLFGVAVGALTASGPITMTVVPPSAAYITSEGRYAQAPLRG
jgi:hypothetical protein